MKRVTKEQIINWLKSRGIKDSFEKNHRTHMARQTGLSEIRYSLDKYYSEFIELVDGGANTMDRFISGAFVWMLTPEGHDYWENIEGKFQKWLDTLPEEELPEVSPKIASLLAGPVFPETLYDIFRTFLKEHGCTVEQFEENMKNDYFRSQDKETITLGKYIEDQNKKYGTVKDLIEHGFIYSGTPQGLGYWDKLHRE